MNGKAEFVTSNNLLELDPATKPKGICLIPGHTNSFLALLGKAKDSSNMMVFPPSAVCERYEVSLRCFNVFLDEDHRKRNAQRYTLTNGGNIRCAEVANIENSPSLRLPDGSIFKGSVEAMGSNRTSLISELTLNEVPEMLGDYSKTVLQGKVFTCVLTVKEKCYWPECWDCQIRSIIVVMALVECGNNITVLHHDQNSEGWIGAQCSSMQLLKCLYEVKNNSLFERPFKVKKNGVFLFGISFFILEIFRVLSRRRQPANSAACQDESSHLLWQ